LSANLNRLQGFKRGDMPADKLAKLEMLIAPSAVDRNQTVALLADLLSLPPSDRYACQSLVRTHLQHVSCGQGL
jgi:hypothetical protein